MGTISNTQIGHKKYFLDKVQVEDKVGADQKASSNAEEEVRTAAEETDANKNGEEVVDQDESDEDISELEFECQLMECEGIFKSEHDLSTHMKEVHEKEGTGRQ